MTTTLSTTTTLTEIVPKIIAKALLIFQASAGIRNTLRVKDTSGQPGISTDFPTYTPVTSSEVETPGEGTKTTHVVDLESVAHAASVEEHVLTARITDLAMENTHNFNDVVDDCSALFASAIMAKYEDDVVNLFGSFSQTAAGAGNALSLGYIWDSIRQIQAGNGDVRNLVGVLSPKQYYGTSAGAKGLVNLFVDAGNATTNTSRAGAAVGPVGDDLARMGFVGRALGIDWLVSNEIDEDVATLGDAAGAIYQRGAIAMNEKDLVRVETARGATGAEARYTALVAAGIWKEVEQYDAWGVYFLSDVA